MAAKKQMIYRRRGWKDKRLFAGAVKDGKVDLSDADGKVVVSGCPVVDPEKHEGSLPPGYAVAVAAPKKEAPPEAGKSDGSDSSDGSDGSDSSDGK